MANNLPARTESPSKGPESSQSEAQSPEAPGEETPDLLAVVRGVVGRRRIVTRQEMADLLVAIYGARLRGVSTMYGGGFDNGDHYICDGVILPAATPPVAVAAAVARVTANMIRRGMTVSAWPDCVRYDEPGSMHPLQMAPLAFASRDDRGTIGYLRRHAERVLLVAEDPALHVDPVGSARIEAERAAADEAKWGRIRRILGRNFAERMDGVYIRLHDDGILEMRNPNDGQSSEIDQLTRYQYRVEQDTGQVMTRALPPECVGDAWRDLGVPQWEPATTPPRDDLLYVWWEEQIQ